MLSFRMILLQESQCPACIQAGILLPFIETVSNTTDEYQGARKAGNEPSAGTLVAFKQNLIVGSDGNNCSS